VEGDLAADFVDDGPGGAAHGAHAEGAEQIRKRAAMKRPMMTLGSFSEKARALVRARAAEVADGFEVVFEIDEIGAEKDDGGEARRWRWRSLW